MPARPALEHYRTSFRQALSGPQTLAFLPAITLGAFWLGGETALLAAALLLPIFFTFMGSFRFTPAIESGARDGVTGYPLRNAVITALDDALTEQQTSGRTTASILVDLDDFHGFSAQYGHKATETLLRRAGERIRGTLRNDDVLARLEGGTFAIAMAPVHRADLETLIQVCARIQAAINEPFSVDATTVYMSASAGFCLAARTPARNGEAMLDATECALIEARRHGPGGLRAYSNEMKQRLDSQSALVEEISSALEAGQIQPWFQPQISTDTGEVTGFEALARWHHPQRGVLAPGEFLPIIQKSGLSERLSEVVLFHSLSALKGWDNAGIKVANVGVNFSSDELRNPKLVDKIRWELDRFDLTPDRLCVEILESVIASSEDDTITQNISALARLGCPVDLDDFGTGHASIANIRRFAVGRLKIDRSFVTKIDQDPDQHRMVAAILTMAEQLQLDTLAEGVETHGEHAMLSQLGCGHVQGFGIARAMPLIETISWIEKHNNKLAVSPTIGKQTG